MSRHLKDALELATDLHDTGGMDDKTFQKIEGLCLSEKPSFGESLIQSMREALAYAKGEPGTENYRVHKARRNRHPKACRDKRRDSHHCGICGSPNLAFQGVISCDVCGGEWEYLETKSFRYAMSFAFEKFDLCHCHDNDSLVFPFDVWEVVVCLDCRALGSTSCPVCDHDSKTPLVLGRNCWTGRDGQKSCQSCGFRRGPQK